VKAPPPVEVAPAQHRPAHAELEKLTAELEAREPALSHAAAFTKVFCANRELAEASKIEHMRGAG